MYKVEVFTLLTSAIMYYTGIRKFETLSQADSWISKITRGNQTLHTALTFTKDENT